MKSDFRLEEQIKQFYDNVPDVDDALPMKDYLLKHENNQMAWYLLGKQYAARGEEGKANYCFAQAGPVFEAFESRGLPLAASPQGLRAEARRRRSRLATAAGVLLLLLGLLLAGDRASAPDAREAAGTGHGTVTAPADGPVPADATLGKLAFVSGATSPAADGPKALGQLLTRTQAPSASLLVQAPIVDAKWVDWLKSGKPLAAVAPTTPSTGAGADVVWYDPKWCPCQLGQNAAGARQAVQAWRPLQEGKLALRSAVIRYHERTGKWPATQADLAGAYPANVMAGWTDDLTPWLNELLAGLKTASAPGWPTESGPQAGIGKPSGKLADLTVKPLEIIVDRTHHRLAVVSGSVLLRNYEVGLGGGRTPEGRFVITEKVRDPNGHSDGEFGSRGMTLSDTLYAIHGTDDPDSIGEDESQGCIRMNRDDLEELFDLVPLGTKVTIAKEGLPVETRVPADRFRLKPAQDETNPHKTYHWLG